MFVMEGMNRYASLPSFAAGFFRARIGYRTERDFLSRLKDPSSCRQIDALDRDGEEC